MHRPSAKVTALTALAAGLIILTMGTVSSARGQDLDSIFGFRPGDERRYALEPADHNTPGKPELFVVRLDSIYVHGEHGRVASFRLAHEGMAVAPYLIRETLTQEIFELTEILVNEHGFPLEIDYVVTGAFWLGPGVHRVALKFKDGEYKVSNPTGMQRREYELELPNEDHIDTEALKGVFLSSELHPALLGLPFAVLGNGTEDIRFTSLDPRMLAGRDTRATNAATADASRVPGGSVNQPRAPRQTDPGPDLRPLRRRTIEFRDFREIEIGPAMWQAHRIEVSGSKDRWAAPDGTVLRLDTVTKWGDAWIRLLRPSEY